MSKVSEKKARQRSRWSEAQRAAFREKARGRWKANYIPRNKPIPVPQASSVPPAISLNFAPPTTPKLPQTATYNPPTAPYSPPTTPYSPPTAPLPLPPPVFAKKSLPTPPIFAKKSAPPKSFFPSQPNFAKYLVKK